MAEATLEKTTCENCGTDVREDTFFCYNCGKKFDETASESNGTEVDELSVEAKTALDELAARFKVEDTESDDKLALAAAERKKARVAPKKPKEVVWEAEDNRSGLIFFAVSLFIFAIVAAIVFITVYWK
ncbi:MAG: hypothetical protein ACKVRN_07180 [Pyrinomonadaceae bacterium]